MSNDADARLGLAGLGISNQHKCCTVLALKDFPHLSARLSTKAQPLTRNEGFLLRIVGER